MAAQPTTSPNQPGTSLPVHRIDVDTYNQIVETGVLDDLRVELLDGVIVDMSPPSPEHSTVIERLTSLFRHAETRLRVQLPFEIRPHSEPQPDLALVEEAPSMKHHPSTALLVVEVAVSSHMIDRNVKAKHYARAGIPTYWLIDVPGRAVEVRTGPGGAGGYENCEIYAEGSLVPSPVQGVADFDVAALLDDTEG